MTDASPASLPVDGTLLAILDRIQVGYYQSDRSGRILLINSAGAAVFGCTPEEMTAGAMTRDFHPEGFDRRVLLDQLEELGFVGSYVSPGWKKDGTPLWINSTLRVLRGKNGAVAGTEGVFRDVTEDVRILKEQAAFARKAKEAHEGLKTVTALQDSLLSSLSHDLLTPPVVMLGFADLLLSGKYGPLSAAQEKPLRTIRNNTRTMTSLVEGLLSFTRIVKAIPSSQPTEEVLASAWESILQRTKEGAAFDLDGCSPAHVVHTDRAVLAFLLDNLAHNCAACASREKPIPCATESLPPGASLLLTLPPAKGGKPDPRLKPDRFFLPAPPAGEEPQGGRPLGLGAGRYVAFLLGGALTLRPSPDGRTLLRLDLP